jgi:hypothetical protein
MQRNGINRRSYSTGGIYPTYLGVGLPSQLANIVITTKQCTELNIQKNNLLTSLTDYFAQKIEKDDLKSQLVSIKLSIKTECNNC